MSAAVPSSWTAQPNPGSVCVSRASSGTGDATAWHFRVSPTPTGARLEQAFQTVALPAWMSAMVGVLMPSHDDRTGALREDMRRAGALAELYHRTQSSA